MPLSDSYIRGHLVEAVRDALDSGWDKPDIILEVNAAVEEYWEDHA